VNLFVRRLAGKPLAGEHVHRGVGGSVMATRYSRTTILLASPPDVALRDELARRGYVLSAGEQAACAEQGDLVNTDAPPQRWVWAEAFEHVCYLGVNASVNMLAYSHWRRGTLVRHLYYCDAWHRAWGEPERWESEVLYGRAAWERAQSYLADCEFEDEQSRVAAYERAERIYGGQQIEEGADLPLCDAETLGWALPGSFGR